MARTTIGNTLREIRRADQRLLFRAGWLGLCALMLAMFVAGQWFLYQELQLPCVTRECVDPFFYLTADDIAELRAIGLSARFYAGYQVGLYVVFFLIHAVLASLIFWRRPEDRMAQYTAFALLVWSATFPSVPITLRTSAPALAWLMTAGAIVGGLSFYLFLFLFPDGRFAPRWMRWVVPFMAVYPTLASFIGPGVPVGTIRHLVVVGLRPYFFALFIVSAVATQIYRYRRVSNAAEREQTRWVFFGIVVGLSWIMAVGLTSAVTPGLQSGPVPKMLVNGLIYMGFLMVPLSIGVAILRARLWDIDLIINRTLVYGALTASVVALYVLVVGYLGTLFQTSGSLLISLVATGLVAVLFQPLRARLQRAVNRLMFGERDDPYAALARLGQRLEGTLAPDAVLPAIVETVGEALKLPYVAVAVRQGEETIVAAEYRDKETRRQGDKQEIDGDDGSRSPGLPVSLPLSYGGEPVGELRLAPRPGEPLGAADRRLLEDLARQAGVAAHAVRLTAELQRARERLVAAREEERRRIRRDLHDGLGPQLASQTLTIDAVFKILPHDPAAAQELLRHLKAQSQAAIADIRRLVYALRPPALDDLGLVAALRDQAAQVGRGEVQIAISAPEPLPPLPAAVEVAVYRIAQEALTNVIRHAGARSCLIELRLGAELEVTIADDGRGMPAERRAGVGMLSMQERAAELGGRLAVEARPGGGTRIVARLPLGR